MIAALQRLLLEKRFSCVELTDWYLNAARRAQPDFSAYITITAEAAQSAAREIDIQLAAGLPLPPLAGVPMALKDNLVTQGIPTTCASQMLSGYIPPYDASVWAFLHEQGAVLLGKTNMDEFAMGATGRHTAFGGVRNPRAPACIAGGSSSGSAAAVAGNLAAYTLGSDTGGSVRQPASFCGIVGLKPTYGSVSRYGLIAHASSLDQIGVLTASVEDAAIVFDAISQPDPHDPTQRAPIAPVGALRRALPAGLRIGLPRQALVELDAPTAAAFDTTLEVYRHLGVSFIELDMPLLIQAPSLYLILSSIEALSNLGRYDGVRYGMRVEAKMPQESIRRTRGAGFGIEVKKRLLFAAHLLHENPNAYQQASVLRAQLASAYADAFSKCDLLLSPTTPTVAPNRSNLDEFSDSDNFVVPASLAGLPAVSFPCAAVQERKLPVGLHLIAPAYCESKLLQAAYAYEQETGGGLAKGGILDAL